MTDSTVTEAEILESLKDVHDPEIGRPLARLKMLKGVTLGDGKVDVHIELPTPAYPRRERITNAIQIALAAKFPDMGDVDVTFSSTVRGKQSGGKIGLRVRNVIAVGSGKGGVGKSTVAAALAYGLKHFGAEVGLLDADIYGPSIPHLVGARGEPSVVEKKNADGSIVQFLKPIETDGIQVMSVGFLIKEEQAVIWRGPMLHKLLTQFLQQTDWGELDYLIIDMPPGTGDVALSLSELLALAGAVVVCTPQQVALLDAVKAIGMFRQVEIPVLGIVESMSGDIFGRGGAREKAEEMGVPFLGEIPSDAEIRIKGDAGETAALFADDSPVREHFLNVCERTAVEIAKQLLSSDESAMPTLEIL